MATSKLVLPTLPPLRDTRVFGQRVCYYDIGEGPPLVLVHGVGGDADQWVFCLDVLEDEPIPVSQVLRDLPNVLLTPHIAGTTEESRFRFFSLMVDELRRHLHGLEPHAQITADTVAGRRGRDVPDSYRRVANA